MSRRMTNEEDRMLQHFFHNVMIRLSHHGWEMEFTQESFCWQHRKIITIGHKVENKKQMILHELAHIGTARFCNQKHNYGFWKYFDDLLLRFLSDEKISQEQIEQRKFASKGRYALVYAP